MANLTVTVTKQLKGGSASSRDDMAISEWLQFLYNIVPTSSTAPALQLFQI